MVVLAVVVAELVAAVVAAVAAVVVALLPLHLEKQVNISSQNKVSIACLSI